MDLVYRMYRRHPRPTDRHERNKKQHASNGNPPPGYDLNSSDDDEVGGTNVYESGDASTESGGVSSTDEYDEYEDATAPELRRALIEANAREREYAQRERAYAQRERQMDEQIRELEQQLATILQTSLAYAQREREMDERIRVLERELEMIVHASARNARNTP